VRPQAKADAAHEWHIVSAELRSANAKLTAELVAARAQVERALEQRTVAWEHNQFLRNHLHKRAHSQPRARERSPAGSAGREHEEYESEEEEEEGQLGRRDSGAGAFAQLAHGSSSPRARSRSPHRSPQLGRMGWRAARSSSELEDTGPSQLRALSAAANGQQPAAGAAGGLESRDGRVGPMGKDVLLLDASRADTSPSRTSTLDEQDAVWPDAPVGHSQPPPRRLSTPPPSGWTDSPYSQSVGGASVEPAPLAARSTDGDARVSGVPSPHAAPWAAAKPSSASKLPPASARMLKVAQERLASRAKQLASVDQ
jgi:hypothetical protein